MACIVIMFCAATAIVSPAQTFKTLSSKGVYYVSPRGSDSNAGTLSQPFRTIQKCATTATSGGTCEILAGTYHETVTPNSGIMIEPYNGESVTVTGADPVTGWSRYSRSIYKASVNLPGSDTSTTFANQVFVGRCRSSRRGPRCCTRCPVISSFTASANSITAGEPVTFTWSVTGATSIQLSGVTAAPASPVTVFPSVSGSYTLTASNANGTVNKSIDITVAPATPIASASIGSAAGQLVASDFTGLGISRGSFSRIFGEPATGTNTVLRQIIKNITQYGASPISYKITASDQYPASAATFVPTSAQVSAMNQLYADTGATFFVGVNLAADVPSIAVTQAQAYASLATPGSLSGMEIGNEPDNYILPHENYRTVPYYFLTDYANFEPDVLSALQMYQPAAKLVGPAWGNPKTVVGGVSGVVNDSGNPITLSDFLTAESSNLAFVSQHGYANQCIGGTKNYTGDFLLTPSAQDCVSTSYLLGGVAPTHAKGLRYRIGETNSMIRGGVSGISNTFQAALWAMDWSAGLAEGGVDGVNWYGDSQKQYYMMFTFNTNVMDGENVYTLDYVTPQYYGVLMFQQATQNSARFLPVNASVSGNQVIYAWIDASNTVRVLILNKDENSAGNVTFTLPTRYGSGTAIRLLEATPNATPAYTSTTGVTLAGQTFDTSTDGVIQGTAYGETITPSGGTYTIAMPITSAALVTLSHNRCRR